MQLQNRISPGVFRKKNIEPALHAPLMRKRKLFHKFMVIPKVFSYLCSIIPFGGLVLQSFY